MREADFVYHGDGYLSDAVLLENLQQRFLDAPGPEVVTEVAGMRAVRRGLMVGAGSVGFNEIDILVLAACLLHEFLGHLLLGGLFLVQLDVEVAVPAVDAADEYYRNARMGAPYSIDEREQTLLYDLGGRIRECIEHEGVGLCILERLGKLRLHLAVPADAETVELQACFAGEHGRDRRAGAGSRCSVHEARSMDDYVMPERPVPGNQRPARLHADLH